MEQDIRNISSLTSLWIEVMADVNKSIPVSGPLSRLRERGDRCMRTHVFGQLSSTFSHYLSKVISFGCYLEHEWLQKIIIKTCFTMLQCIWPYNADTCAIVHICVRKCTHTCFYVCMYAYTYTYQIHVWNLVFYWALQFNYHI